jgi:hypothetical protein
MDPFRKMLLVGCVTCVFAAAPFASAQRTTSGSDDSAQRRRSAPPVPRNDVPIPRNDPPPAGSTDRLPPPSRRPPAERRPSQPREEEDDRSAQERARDLRDDAARRHGSGDPDSSGGSSGGDRDGDRDRGRDRGHDRPRGGYGYPPYYYGNSGYYGNGGYYNNGGSYGGYDQGYDSGYERGVRDGLSQQRPIEPRTNRPLDDADAAADDGRMDRKPPPGMPRVPPDEILGDTDVSPELRKALDASPEYKKATAELIKAWTQYAEAAEKVLEGLALSQRYKLALSEARKAEAALAQLSNGRGNPADDKLLAATGEARKARDKVRAMERMAIDTDKSCQRLRKNLELVIEKRKKIRDSIAAKLPPEARKQAAPAGAFQGAAPEAETPGVGE